MADTPASLDLLAPPPGRGTGVRRLNRRPVAFAMLILAAIMAAVAYTYHLRLQATRLAQSKTRDGAIGVFNGVPDAGFIPPKAPETIPILPEPQPLAVVTAPLPPAPDPNDPRRLAWENYYKRLEQLRQAREQLAFQAIEAKTDLGASIKTPHADPNHDGESARAPFSASEQFARLAADRLERLEEGGRERDLNRQREKAEFVAERDPKTRAQNTLQAKREAAATPYDVKAGTVIPAVMIGGVNSDLPGQLLAQVSANVYDTATGRFIVIPQGSKLVGTYDSAVTTGQERVLVAWTRIIYPDASSVDLGRMPGADQGGYAGFHDQVDNHFLKVWGNALLLSAFSAGIQLSQGNGNNQSGNLNATQTIAASTGQQLGQLGQEIARRNLQIQPTLEIRPGYPFVVQVTKDLLLKPWRTHMTSTAFYGGWAYREGVQRP